MMRGACTSKKVHNKPLKRPNHKIFETTDYNQNIKHPRNDQITNWTATRISDGKVSKSFYFPCTRHCISTNRKSHHLLLLFLKCTCIFVRSTLFAQVKPLGQSLQSTENCDIIRDKLIHAEIAIRLQMPSGTISPPAVQMTVLNVCTVTKEY